MTRGGPAQSTTQRPLTQQPDAGILAVQPDLGL